MTKLIKVLAVQAQGPEFDPSACTKARHRPCVTATPEVRRWEQEGPWGLLVIQISELRVQ